MHTPLHFDRAASRRSTSRSNTTGIFPLCVRPGALIPGSERRGLSQSAARESCVPTVAVRRRPTQTTVVVEVRQPPERAPNQARRSAMHPEKGDGVARLCRPVSQLIVKRHPPQTRWCRENGRTHSRAAASRRAPDRGWPQSRCARGRRARPRGGWAVRGALPRRRRYVRR